MPATSQQPIPVNLMLMVHCRPWLIMPKASRIMLCRQFLKCNYYASRGILLTLCSIMQWDLTLTQGPSPARCYKFNMADYGCVQSSAIKLIYSEMADSVCGTWFVVVGTTRRTA